MQRGVTAHDQRRHGLGDPVPHAVGLAEHPRRVTHGGPRLDGGERDDLGHLVAAVPLGGVAHHVGPVALVEVHVDVGHLLAARVQEALEQQVVADGVEIDDPQAVGHAASGRRTSARTDPDARLTGEADQVPHHEEVGGEPHVADDTELVVEPLDHLGRQRGCRSAGAHPPWSGRAGRPAPGPRRSSPVNASGTGNSGRLGRPSSIWTSARSAISNVLSQASGTSANRCRISAAVFR